MKFLQEFLCKFLWQSLCMKFLWRVSSDKSLKKVSPGTSQTDFYLSMCLKRSSWGWLLTQCRPYAMVISSTDHHWEDLRAREADGSPGTRATERGAGRDDRRGSSRLAPRPLRSEDYARRAIPSDSSRELRVAQARPVMGEQRWTPPPAARQGSVCGPGIPPRVLCAAAHRKSRTGVRGDKAGATASQEKSDRRIRLSHSLAVRVMRSAPAASGTGRIRIRI